MNVNPAIDTMHLGPVFSGFAAPQLPTRQQLVEMLHYLLLDESKLIATAALSYRHQLGFEKFLIDLDHSGACLRIHYWDGGESEEDIHSHCADFSSRILLGQLTEETFTLSAGESLAMYRYFFDAEKKESVARGYGYSSVQIKRSRTLAAGDIYTVKAGGLHRVTAVAPGTITVSSWSPRFQNAIVLKPANQEADPCCIRAGMDIEYLRMRLSTICQELQ